MRLELTVIRDSFPGRAALSVAVSRAILLRVAAGELPPTVRLHRPARVLAFSRQDAAQPGLPVAVRAAREHGFEPVVRLAGGRAAVYSEGTVALSRAIPDRNPARGTHERFAEVAETVADALRGLGVDARVGEVPGEYCPGAYSVNARGWRKLAGIGQRLVRGGAHLGAVVVVRDEEPIRRVLGPVNAALGIEWDPGTVGSVSAETGGTGLEQVEEALLAEIGRRHELSSGELDSETLELAESLEAEHRTRG